jgi:hypothetical protein
MASFPLPCMFVTLTHGLLFITRACAIHTVIAHMSAGHKEMSSILADQ